MEKFFSPQFHLNSAAQTLISVSGVNPHHPLNGTKTIMRIKLQRRDKAVHLPCMAECCLSNYRALQTQTKQKKKKKKSHFNTNTLFTFRPDVLGFICFGGSDKLLQAIAEMLDQVADYSRVSIR